MSTQEYSKCLKQFYSLIGEIAQYLPPEKLNQLFHAVSDLIQAAKKVETEHPSLMKMRKMASVLPTPSAT